MTQRSTGTSDRELAAFNAKATGADDENGEPVGGLTGWTWGGTCGVSMLWVHADHRAGGWGGKLLAAAEDQARRRGCARMVLSSFTFQAPDFYRRHGYVETGRAEGYPAGNAQVHFLRTL
ncbi:hypothetical protein GCM10022223_40010 [Kineosporia mesophila]|uniref:N-acetyltransferase domain-containing protein n=1 Tax=Kineosporia mesophila TaxID=566012 RepID=A0ABP6ZU13_9ACTN|nr:GNAT family N-acetyltransferase [Kineosporia mesophila]MCD5348620.1 GNAT family N-acetyltransferase [Kineosporia mesophila]